MRELLRYRAMAAVCRHKMALYPKHKGKWEIEAIQWDMRALELISYHFREGRPQRYPPIVDRSRTETIAVAL
jgi:hypothetical protein